MAKRRLRGAGVVAIVFLVLASLSAAVVAGWAAANTLVVSKQQHPQPSIQVISLPEYSDDVSIQMPDVRGLAAEDAKQALVDAGIPASFVTTTERPAAGASGRVIQQTPVFGAVNPTVITLVVSTPAAIPASAGQPAADVIAGLQILGARVEQIRIFEPGTTVGTVVRTDPDVGSDVPEIVTVYISDTPVTRSLNEFETIDGYTSVYEDLLHRGIKYDEAILLRDGYDKPGQYAWDIGGGATTWEATYALTEDSDGPAVIVVLGDGQEIARISVTSTDTAPLAIDLRGVNTLVVQVERADPEYSTEVYILDPLILGSFSQMGSAHP